MTVVGVATSMKKCEERKDPSTMTSRRMSRKRGEYENDDEQD